MCSFELSHVHHLFFDHWGLGQAPSIATLFSGGQNQLGHQWRGWGGVSAWLLNMLPCNIWPRLSKKQNQLQPCTCHPGPWQSSKSLVLPTRAPPSACPAVRRGVRQGVGTPSLPAHCSRTGEHWAACTPVPHSPLSHPTLPVLMGAGSMWNLKPSRRVLSPQQGLLFSDDQLRILLRLIKDT